MRLLEWERKSCTVARLSSLEQAKKKSEGSRLVVNLLSQPALICRVKKNRNRIDWKALFGLEGKKKNM